MNTLKKLNILVVGGGGREHAVIKKLMESPKAGKIYAAPGNGVSLLTVLNVSPLRLLILTAWLLSQKSFSPTSSS